jgi:hypothetical protein
MPEEHAADPYPELVLAAAAESPLLADSASAGDPFATFWLDETAPTASGLTPGYLPPLTGMWQTPAGNLL